MSDSAMVVSSDEISVDDLSNFVSSLGGSAVPQETSSFVVNDQGTDLWVAIQDKEFASDFYGDDTLNEWKQFLGSDIKTIIELQLDHTPLSKQLYLYFVFKLGEKWNIVLDDIDDSVVNYSDLVSMYKRNNGDLTLDKKCN